MAQTQYEMNPEVLISDAYWQQAPANPHPRLFSLANFRQNNERRRMYRDTELAEHIGGLALAAQPGDDIWNYYEGELVEAPGPNSGQVLKAVLDVRAVFKRNSYMHHRFTSQREFYESAVRDSDFEECSEEILDPVLMPVQAAKHMEDGPDGSIILFQRIARYLVDDDRYRSLAGVDYHTIAQGAPRAVPTFRTSVGRTFLDHGDHQARIIAATLLKPTGTI